MALGRREFIKKSSAVGLTVGGTLYFSGFGQSADAQVQPLRPPGALPEADFTSTCIRCMRCVDACPNRALVPIEHSRLPSLAGTPTMHPRKASCMLCMLEDGDFLKCTEACPSGALQLVRKDREEVRRKVRIGVAELDPGLCYSYNNWSCGACFRACPLAGEAMTLGSWEKPTVHPESCIGCGCCERSCIRYPHAIRVKVQGKG